MTYNKLLKTCSLIAGLYFFDIAINIACGPEMDPYDNQTTYFLPNISTEEYAAFQFIPYKFLYQESEVKSEAEVNIDLWASHLKAPQIKNDIRAVMYRADSATVGLLLNQQIPDSLQGNQFLKSLAQHPAEREYFLFTKAIEPYTNYSYDYWDPAPVDTEKLAELSVAAESKISAFKKGSFLYVRYAYQAARIALIGKDYGRSMALYEQFIKPIKSNDPLMGWALSNYAGAVRWEGEPARAAFLFAQVFSQNPERRILAYKNFNYIDTDKAEILAFAKSNTDKFNINAILGFNSYRPSIDYLSACYALDPKNEIINMLLIREINKIEEQVITPFSIAYGYDAWRQSVDKTEIIAASHQLRDFALQIAREKKSNNPVLGTLAAAYLSFLTNENQLAKNYLADIHPENLSGNIKDQYEITRLLTSINDWKEGAPVDEDLLSKTLTWLQQRAQKENRIASYDSAFEDAPFSLIGRNILSNIIVPHYLAIGDTTKASLAALKSDIFERNGLVNDTLGNNIGYGTDSFWKNYLNSSGVQHIIDAFKTSQQQDIITQFFLAGIQHLDLDYLYELQGTNYIREHNYAAALRSFAQMKKPLQALEAYNIYEDDLNYPAPFIESLNDYPKPRGSKNMSKVDYAKQMYSLQQSIAKEKSGEALANLYFKLALGEYHSSTYGNSWMFKSYYWSSYDSYSQAVSGWQKDYIHTATAKKWFEKAYQSSKNKEFRAKCVFWMAKCEQKEFEYSDDTRWQYYENFKDSPFYMHSMENAYFKLLKNQFKDTRLYQAAVRECTYFADFISRR